MARSAPRILAALVVVAVICTVVLVMRRAEPPSPAPPTAEVRDGDGRAQQAEAPPPPAAPLATPAKDRAVASDGGAASGRARGTLVIRGAWGSGPGQFGRKRDPESNPEAPMAMVAGAGGEVAIVDQVNRRVQRFAGGKLVGTVSVGGDTVQDIAMGEGGRTVLLDRLADRNVQIYDRDGKLLNEAALVGEGIPEGGGVTGVFTDDKGIYVEREHQALVRIADTSGNSVPRQELPGRPTRDGRLLVTAVLVDRQAGTIQVKAIDRATLRPAWEQVISTGAMVLSVLMLDSDRNGMVYVAASTGHESPQPPFQIVDEAIVVARLGPGGQVRGMLQLPAVRSPDETFRSMSVDDNGSVYAMEPGPTGLSIVRYSF